MTDSMQKIIQDLRVYASAVTCGLSCSCNECSQCAWVQLDPNTFADRLEAWQAALSAQTEARDAKPLDEYHEDMGPVTWWSFPIREAAWIGTPNDSDWPEYHTHFTPHPVMPSNHEEIAQGDL